MPIANDHVVSIDYTLTGPDGRQIDTSIGRATLVYLHGRGGIIPGLAAALEGKSAGDAFTVTVPADQAYGPPNPQLIQVVPRTSFPKGTMILVGQQFEATAPGGHKMPVRVTQISGADVKLDANHELAGVPLTFAVTVVDVRPATAEELAHGHAHGGPHH